SKWAASVLRGGLSLLAFSEASVMRRPRSGCHPVPAKERAAPRSLVIRKRLGGMYDSSGRPIPPPNQFKPPRTRHAGRQPNAGTSEGGGRRSPHLPAPSTH